MRGPGRSSKKFVIYKDPGSKDTRVFHFKDSMDLETRERKLRAKIDSQNFVMCKHTLQELVDIKMQRAYIQHSANKKLFGAKISVPKGKH